jgi:hypothetical protein
LGALEAAMTDLIYGLGVMAGFALTWALVRLCEKVQ